MAGAARKRRVLLVDSSSPKREIRAEAMRKLGVDVDCACDIGEARSWWRAALYDLVLMNLESESGLRDQFCEDVRRATPPQQLAFLVGKPEYLAAAPNGGDLVPLVQSEDLLSSDIGTELAKNIADDLPQRWGILEASRRISAVRSVCAAHSSAMRNRPVPPRDVEMRAFKRDRTGFGSPLNEYQKEEML